MVEESPVKAERDIEQIIPEHWLAHNHEERPDPVLHDCITTDVLYIIEVFDNLHPFIQGQVYDILFQQTGYILVLRPGLHMLGRVVKLGLVTAVILSPAVHDYHSPDDLCPK